MNPENDKLTGVSPISRTAKGIVVIRSKNKIKTRIAVWLRTDIVQGALILTGLLLIFFSTPLFNIFNSYYSAVDIAQPFSLMNVKPPAGYETKNYILSDTTFSYNSFYMFNRESLWSGQIPLWNPYNGGGVPHLANYQSAIFSIFTIPYYFLPFKLGLLLTAFMKLFSLGFFTFLFLKQLKLHQLASLIGATGFMFSGYHIVWLQYTVTGVVITLPAGLYFAERIFSRVEAGQQLPYRHYLNSLAGLCLSVLAGLLAAHPETFFYSLLLLVSYILFRLLNLAHRLRYKRAAISPLYKVAGQMILAGLLGMGLAAIQIIPFAEYLQHSLASTERLTSGINQINLPANLWALLFFPDTLGNPTTSFGATYINYNERNGQYIGFLMMLLAFFSLSYVFKDKYIRFFAFMAVLWMFYSYDLMNVHKLINLLPGMQFGYVLRSYPIWLFSVSCCAALFVHYQLESGVLSKLKWSLLRLRSLLLGVIGVIFLVAGIYATRDMVLNQYSLLQPYQKGFLRYVPGHVWFIGLTLGVGLLAAISMGLFRRRFIQVSCGCVLLGMVFMQSGWLLKEYNPTVDNRYFYPATEALGRLREKVGTRTVMQTSWNSIPVNMNTIYKFSEIPNYDSLWINYYERLAREMFGTGEQDLVISVSRSSEKAFKLFGVEYFLSVKEPFSLDIGMTEIQFPATTRSSVAEILPGQQISQTFKAQSPDLRQILISPYTYNRENSCNLDVQLEDMATSQLVASKQFKCSELQNDTLMNFSFTPQPASSDREYRLLFSSADSKPGQAVSLVYKPELNYPEGQLTINGKIQKGGLDFDFFEGNTTNFADKGNADYRRVYQYKPSLGRYYTVSQVDIAQTDAVARQKLDDLNFDPYKSVILSLPTANGLPAATEPAAPAQIISEEAQVVQLKATRTQPGFLVLTKPFYPGWKVQVNGVEKPLLRADYAFNAVQLEAGVSDVKFYYDPFSFKLGALISFLSLCAGLVVLLGWNRITRAIFKKKVDITG